MSTRSNPSAWESIYRRLKRCVVRAFTSLSLLITLYLLPGCALFVGAHEASQQAEGERVYVTVNYVSPRVQEKAAIAGLAMSVLPQAYRLARQQVAAQFEAERERQQATYETYLAAGDFYTPASAKGTPELNVASLDVVREVVVAGERRTAFALRLAVQPAPDGMAFQLIPVDVILNYTKAKLPDYLLRTPDTDVDLEIEILLDALWANETEVNDARIGEAVIALRGVPLNATYQARPLRDGEPIGPPSRWLPPVPRSISRGEKGERVTGTGNFVVHARVRETAQR